MDIKNTLSGFSAKHKIIALAGFVCLAVIVGFFFNKGGVADYAFALTCGSEGGSCTGAACSSTTNNHILSCIGGVFVDKGVNNGSCQVSLCTGTANTNKAVQNVVGTDCKSSTGYTCGPNGEISGSQVYYCPGAGSVWTKTGLPCGCFAGQCVNGSGSTTATPNDDWEDGVAPAKTSSGLNCSLGAIGASCAQDAISCCYTAATKQHTYCNSNGKVTLAQTTSEYCGACGPKDPDACGCVFYDGSAANPLSYGVAKCGKGVLRNTNNKCDWGDGNKGGVTDNVCLNGMGCTDSNGCGTANSKCVASVAAVEKLINYVNNNPGYITSDAKPRSSLSKTNKAAAQAVLDAVAKYANFNAVSIVEYAKYYDDSDGVACTTDQTSSDANGGTISHGTCSEDTHKSYRCTDSQVGDECFVWQWVTGGSTSCDQNQELNSQWRRKWCEYLVEQSTGKTLPTGECYKKGSGATPEIKCDAKNGKTSGYVCDTNGKVYNCAANGEWVGVMNCPDDVCDAVMQKCGAAATGSCTKDADCGSGKVCAFKDKASLAALKDGVCLADACVGSGSAYYQPSDVHFCSSSLYYHCGTLANGDIDWITDETCAKGCDAATSKCATGKSAPGPTDCAAKAVPCKGDDNECANCGTGWQCVPRQNTTQDSISALGIFNWEQVYKMTSNGVCLPSNKIPTPVTTAELTVNCRGYLNATGACANCTTNKPFDKCTVADGISGIPQAVTGKSGQTSFEKCLTNAGTGDTTNAGDTTTTKKTSQVAVTLYVDCEVKDPATGVPQKAHDEAACEGTAGPANTYNPSGSKNPDNQGAANGESCTNDSDCASGLVCQDHTCVTKKDADKTNNTAPTVSITSPSGTVKDKTADLKATTNLKSTCTFSNTCGNNTVTGMTMNTSDGYSHTATLSSLAKGSCTVTVTCKNAAADTTATAATGTNSATYTVDLSGNSEYKPTVTSATDAKFDIANPVLKVTTNLPAACQFKKDSTFTYGSGTKFDTTGTDTAGTYNHNTQLTSLTSTDYTYYVVCQGTEAGANSDPLAVKFTVDLSGSAPAIDNTTPLTQTVTNPTLSITTNLPAACQYKKDSTFTYGDSSATQFGNDADYSHTASLASYADGSYKFFVACKGDSTGAAKTYDKAIETTLSRTGSVGPTISNTTGSNQTTSTPILSITTGTAATCQYKEGADFTYGNGTQLTDSSTGHSVTLPTLADGPHTFYVICKDTASGVVNASGTQIIFTVAAGSTTCAKLSSNDKQNDDDRDSSDSDNSDSTYLWRSAENGTRGEFSSVDWYAGYQFTTNEDGKVTQLCGYFASGDSNKVSLYNSSYKVLATATVKGDDDWKCVSISPVAVKSDKHYYVIARVDNGPINYEYESGLLPTDGDNAVVEAGIRQLATDDFGNDIKKYDYMVFGLVDVRISFTSENSEGPEVSSPIPVGTVKHDYATLSVETDKAATCKFDRDDVEYADMGYTFGTTGAKTHEQKVCELDDGNFTWYVRCKNASGGDVDDASTLVQFETSN